MRTWSLLLAMWLLAVPSSLWAAPDQQMSVAPTATSGDTIRAADENNRNNSISTSYNAHSHTDISSTTANTVTLGDGTAGNKTLCANAADATDRCLRWNDTVNAWTMDQTEASVFSTVLVSSGTSALTTNALLVAGNLLGLVDDLITLAGTQPATYGDVSARAYNSGAISVTSGTATLMTLDSERWDTDTIHSTSSNTSRLTATTAGKYEITGHVEFAAPTLVNANGQRLLQILLNGATVIAAQECGYAGQDPARVQACTISTHYNLAATDYVELRVTQRVQTTLNINASANYSPEFEMVKVP